MSLIPKGLARLAVCTGKDRGGRGHSLLFLMHPLSLPCPGPSCIGMCREEKGKGIPTYVTALGKLLSLLVGWPHYSRFLSLGLYRRQGTQQVLLRRCLSPAGLISASSFSLPTIPIYLLWPYSVACGHRKFLQGNSGDSSCPLITGPHCHSSLCLQHSPKPAELKN